MNTTVHDGWLEERGYRCRTCCSCGWRSPSGPSGDDAWTAWTLHKRAETEIEADEGQGGPRVPFGWQGRRRR